MTALRILILASLLKFYLLLMAAAVRRRLVFLSVLLSFFINGAKATCSSSCNLALASYYVWDQSNLTIIAFCFPFSHCDCINGEYLAHLFTYTVKPNDTYDIIAKKYYSNLTTTEWLQSWNSYPALNIPNNAQLNVTVNFYCGNTNVSNAYGLFVTYPLRPGDTLY
ncbi:hypothetical protein NE237_020945 [Protea cynaroides]|uniref:LysM domain-containing protein n=1 Tax=Protea cynaroides TaxID=273540 RepID=A0A9Q0H875_9MAGN|nr:hypothetical protein NE237_020945 [Protea cynaroides]